MKNPSTPRYHRAIIIGAGQAGLAMSYCLQQAGVDNIILEKTGSIAANWRHQRWDSFCLVTPNWQCQLPGFDYCGKAFNGRDPHGFMVKEQIIHYLESYRDFFKPKIVFNCAVEHLTKKDAAFVLKTAAQTYIADQVIIACGSYHRPSILTSARDMPEYITHIHSQDYKSPERVPEGEVLVVGTGQSGCQIAEDLHLAGRKVHLAVGTAPRVNRRYRGRDVVDWLDDMGYYRTTIATHPESERAAHATNHYVTGRDGGRDINLRLFALQGMALYGRLKSASPQSLSFCDDLQENLDSADAVAKRIADSIEDYIQKHNITAEEDSNYSSDFAPTTAQTIRFAEVNIRTVIWATGFTTDYDWVQLPVFDPRGRPMQDRGVSPVNGLYFLGLNWMHTWGSGRFYHVGRDAEYLCGNIVASLNRSGENALPVH